MLRNISAWHVLIVVLVVVLLFGAKRLPDLAKSVGQSMKIFKHEVKDLRDDDAPTATTTTSTTTTTVPDAPAGVTPVGAPPAVPPAVEPHYVTPVRPAEAPSEGNAPPKA